MLLMVFEQATLQTCKNSFGVEKVWDSLGSYEEGRTKYSKKLTFLSNTTLTEWSDDANGMKEDKSNQHNLLSTVILYGQQWK